MNPRENAIRQHIKMLDYRLTELKIYQFKKKKALEARIAELNAELKEITNDDFKTKII